MHPGQSSATARGVVPPPPRNIAPRPRQRGSESHGRFVFVTRGVCRTREGRGWISGDGAHTPICRRARLPGVRVAEPPRFVFILKYSHSHAIVKIHLCARNHQTATLHRSLRSAYITRSFVSITIFAVVHNIFIIIITPYNIIVLRISRHARRRGYARYVSIYVYVCILYFIDTPIRTTVTCAAHNTRGHIYYYTLILVYYIIYCCARYKSRLGSAELTAKRFRRTDRPRTVRAACLVHYARGARAAVKSVFDSVA